MAILLVHRPEEPVLVSFSNQRRLFHGGAGAAPA
jgi:hypothetical protein